MRVKGKLELNEHQIQSSYFDEVRLRANSDWRYSLIFAIPNGGKLPYKNVIRSGKKVRICPQAQWLLAEGLRPGVLDVFCPFSKFSRGLFIEFKAGNNKLTEEQEKFIILAEKAGYATEVCRSAESAMKVTKQHIEG